jgi:signal transduction histidine kinase
VADSPAAGQADSGGLARLAQDLGTARDVRSVFQALRVYCEELTGSSGLYVSLLDAEQRQRYCVYAWSDGKEVDAAGLPPLPLTGSSPHARAILTGDAVVVEDLEEVMARIPNVGSGFERDPREMQVSIALPLAVLGRVIGGFEIQIIEHADPWACVPALRVAANLAAAAIDNVRMVTAERQLRQAAEASEQRYRLATKAERRARTEAEAAVRARDEFLSVAAHELKTPVTSLHAYAQVMLRRLAQGRELEPARLSHALQVIEQESDKLGRLVTLLLDLARLETGRLQVDPRPTDLVTLARAVLDRARARTSRHGLQLEGAGTLMADVDALRLEQVLVNLVDNAIKYSPDGGTIRVDVSAPAPEWVQLAVSDHGLGIPPDRRPRLFERFYRAHDESYTSGMGLGLFISKEIVKQHGGSLTAEFPPEGGTRMVVRLPVAGEARRASARAGQVAERSI